ncbi:lysophospholipid acyltransferase family protein [Emticicia sp. 17c]|uniref:lysophospholipid acyltransferase family protein n=1 Tax=Emticicia sp. 17c TaxID=3127704 RepID=UPI00301E4EC8
MKAVGYYLSLPFLYFISILPLPVLYALSDFLYVIIYYVIGYRKAVVRLNIKNSFPEKTQEERLKIERDFYKYIVDFFLEMFKCLTIPKEKLLERISLGNKEIIEELYKKGENIIITTGHYGNHEWVNQVLPYLLPYKIKTIYRTQHNPFFDRLFMGFRSKYGTEMIAMNDSYKEMRKKDADPFVLIVANDQSAVPDKAFWTTFLNQETSFFTGTEVFAHKFNIPVVFVCITRPSRGRYHAIFEMITEHPQEFPKGKILEMHAQKLEKYIRQDPAPWMWSHKRWKYKKINGKYVDVNYKHEN